MVADGSGSDNNSSYAVYGVYCELVSLCKEGENSGGRAGGRQSTPGENLVVLPAGHLDEREVCCARFEAMYMNGEKCGILGLIAVFMFLNFVPRVIVLQRDIQSQGAL
jgi:hypothetical protein